MDTGVRIAMVAGEESGDQLAAPLIAALRRRLPGARFFGIGGAAMQSHGFESWYSMETLSVRGYAEAVRSIPRILSIRRGLKARLLSDPPDVFIGVDAPDFNLALEESLRNAGVPTVHYVSPSIWAWRGERIHRIKRAADRVLTLFPFEVPLYERAGVPVTYVGHPYADELPEVADRDAAREQLRLPTGPPVFALLPGSRQGELVQHAGLFVETAKRIRAQLPEARFLIPLSSRATRRQFLQALYDCDAGELPATVLFGHARVAMTAADVVLVASGTAALEAALLGRPMVITYRVPALTWRLMWPRRYLPYVGLPNVLAGRFVVPEILQQAATAENLAQALINQLHDKFVRERQISMFGHLYRQLRRGAADCAAEAVLPVIRRRTADVQSRPPRLAESSRS